MREEEKKRTSLKQYLNRYGKKRWIVPAAFLASVALILAGVLWFQNRSDNLADNKNKTEQVGKGSGKEPSILVNKGIEMVKMPVSDPNTVKIKRPFYDYNNGTAEDQESALVFYNNMYHPNTGIDLVREDGKTFDVVASISGTVSKVEEDPLLGQVIEIDHGKGIATVYQSLDQVKVKTGDLVEQGQVIGQAGQSIFDQEIGIHAHFEIRKDQKAINPIDYFEQPLTALTENQQEKETEKNGTETEKEENGVEKEIENGNKEIEKETENDGQEIEKETENDSLDEKENQGDDKDQMDSDQKDNKTNEKSPSMSLA